MSRQEFDCRVKNYKRVMLPFAVVWLGFLFAGPFGLFAYLFGILEPSLQELCPESPEVCFAALLLLLLLVLPYAALMFVSRYYRLFCAQCGPWVYHVFFIQHVARHGRCPKCKRLIVSET